MNPSGLPAPSAAAAAAAPTEYDKQFQADLERATALSMETLALDQYKRNKLQYSHSDVTPASSGSSASASRHSVHHQLLLQQQQQQHHTTYTPVARRPRPESVSSSSPAAAAASPYASTYYGLQSSASSGSLAPPPSVPPRRASDHPRSVRGRSTPTGSTSDTTTTTTTDTDLISFSQPAPAPAPTDGGHDHFGDGQPRPTAAPAKDAHAQFQQMVSDMHRMNTQLQQIPPAYRYAIGAAQAPSATPPNVLAAAAASAAAAAANSNNGNNGSTQLVPYQPSLDQPVPLDAEQLHKLYSMNYAPPGSAVSVNPTGYGCRPAVFATAAPSVYPSLSNAAFPAANPTAQYSHSAAASITRDSRNATATPPPPPLANPAYGWDLSSTPTASAAAPPLPATQSPLPSLPLTNCATNSGSMQQPFRRRPSRAPPLLQSPTTNTTNLIDLENGSVGVEDNSRVSVLEAFDPLLMGNRSTNDEYAQQQLANDCGADRADAASECGTSYYSEYDPFDYLYNSGTQYSDPVYDAVNRADAHSTPSVHGAPAAIGWNVGETVAESLYSPTTSEPPPLPPRRSTAHTPPTAAAAAEQLAEAALQLDRRKTAAGSGGGVGVAAGSTRKLYNQVVLCKTFEPELLAFYEMVRRLRGQYKWSDRRTNVGHVVATEFNNRYPAGTSIKLLVHPAMECMRDGGVASERGQVEGYGAPVAFTCDISTTVEHVIMHVFCELEGVVQGAVGDYNLKPIGLTEWLSTSSKLSQLECVHNSIKLDLDVQLGLCPRTAATMDVIARTLQDDLRDADLKPEDIVAHEPVVETINFDNLMILLETLEDEIAKFESVVADAARHTVISCSGIVQAVKMVCALLGAIDTLDITGAIADLQRKCRDGQTVISYRDAGSQLDIVSESGVYAEVSLRPKTVAEAIRRSCDAIRAAVQSLLETYSHAFRVDFYVQSVEYVTQPLPISYVSQAVMVRLMCVHRPPPHWLYDSYMLGAQIYHGTRYIGDAEVAQCPNEISGLFPRLTIDSWLKFEHIPVCTLPREARLIFVLYGCTTEPLENQTGDSSATSGGSQAANSGGGGGGPHAVPGATTDANGVQRRITKVELGWTAIQFFEFERRMIKGSYLLALWPPTTDKFLGPAPAKGTHPRGYHCPVLSVEIPPYGGHVVFPADAGAAATATAPRLDFTSLDCNLQQELVDTAELGYPSAVDKREVLWEKRHYLHTALPHALPKVLHAAHSWDFASLVDLHALVRSWQPLSPLQSLELLLPRYPDMTVRAQAVGWIAAMRSDQLVDYLPQLLQALKHDTYEASPMAEFLLSRALESPRVAHHLYWQLVHSLPGESPHNSSIGGGVGGGGGGGGVGGAGGTAGDAGASGAGGATAAADADAYIMQARYTRRNQMMLRALLVICGERLATRLLGQDMMCKALGDCALSVQQQGKDSARNKALLHGLDGVQQVLSGRPLALPLAPGAEVAGVNARTSGYFNSNTLPLRVNFAGPDGRTVAAIFKAGDDLQQDQLTIQLVRIMDKLWLEEGLDLKMVTFNCVPTGRKKGMIEMVSEAETLRKIQVEWGLTGSFKDKPIAEWLARQNPSQLEYQRAVENFTVSCAGYSVATYILGICDRHNDNIMLKTSGHLFHIDFGKFLGDAQMFGNFKRDRTPFVLTSDMAYVINGGDRPSTKFHHFVDLCCQAFNIVRKHGDLILHMVALMATSGIPGVTADAVNYVRKALLPGQSNPEAAAAFAKMIHISLKSWFTQFNFFLHNLAQLRFTGDEGNGELLSFVPRTYTMSQDGRLKSVTVHGFQKRYDLEKYYTFILKVTRQSQPDPAYLFRSYKEFSEFHQKLCMHYPLAKLHSLPSGIHVGRSNIKTVAERRLPEIRHFLVSLFNSADEIAHSDVVYTFFHPLLRDQQEQDIHVAKVKENNKPLTPKERVCGEIKLSLQYHRGALTVMIHHARSLPATTSGQEPNTYVKTYLKPDPTKVTKRKTKVVRKNCFPSYMETLEYRMPIESIQHRVLQVTVWSHDSLQENEFLGGVELPFVSLDLTKEMVNWFPLRYLSRS